MIASIKFKVERVSRGESLVKALWFFSIITILIPIVTNIFTGALKVAGYEPKAHGVLIREVNDDPSAMSSPVVKMVEPLRTKYVLALRERTAFQNRKSLSTLTDPKYSETPLLASLPPVSAAEEIQEEAALDSLYLTLPAAQSVYEMADDGNLAMIDIEEPKVLTLEMVNEDSSLPSEGRQSGAHSEISAKEFVKNLIREAYEEEGVESEVFPEIGIKID